MTSSDNDFDDEDNDFLLALTTKKSQSLNLGGVRSMGSTAGSATNTPNTSNTSALAYGRTAALPSSSPSEVDPSIQAKLYRADGEIAILREKYQQLQNLRQLELTKVKESQQSLQRQNEEQLKALQFTVQKLEDEKRFLNNEIKGITSKRRKVRDSNDDMDVDGLHVASTLSASTFPVSGSGSGSGPSDAVSTGPRVSSSQVVRILNDTSLFFDHIWNYCINGAQRTSLTFLSKIYIERDVNINELQIKRKIPISIAVVDYLMLKKKLRLDELVSEFTTTIAQFVELLLEEENLILSVPFLLSLIHSAISFRPLAVVKPTVNYLLRSISKISRRFLFILEETQNQEDYITYHDVPEQVLVLEKITLICSVDIIEKLSAISTLHGVNFVRNEIWGGELPCIPRELVKRLLPENTERLKNSSQINLVFNIVEMLMSSITEELFAYSNFETTPNQMSPIFNSLFKVLLVDIPLRDDFMIYGLNRILGNIIDIKKVESLVPVEENALGYSLVMIPCPIPQELKSERRKELHEGNDLENGTSGGSFVGIHDKLNFELNLKHQNHLLKLRIRVAMLLEHFIVSTSLVTHLQLKDYIKSMVRTIGFEQSNILKSPRSKDVHLRAQLIANLVRILHYISSDNMGGITNLVYPETMYEIYVSLLRIAFGSNSLTNEAHSILKSVRSQEKYFNTPIFNKWCEARAKLLNHIDQSDDSESSKGERENGSFIADIESEYANGLEFPYEEEAVELAREILDQCVTHEEADNLFFNMNYEDPNLQEDEYTRFDEMDLVN